MKTIFTCTPCQNITKGINNQILSANKTFYIIHGLHIISVYLWFIVWCNSECYGCQRKYNAVKKSHWKCHPQLENYSDQWEGRKVIQILLISVVQARISTYCHWILKRWDKVWKSEVELRGKQVRCGVTPKPPQLVDVLVKRPLCRYDLILSTE